MYYLSWYTSGRAADWTLDPVWTHVTIVHLSILRCIWSPRQAHHFWLIRTQKSLNKFTLCQAFYSTLITLSRYGFSLQFLNCPKYWWNLCYFKLILTLSAESVSPHLDLTCLKTLFTMTRQVPGFYLATFRYLELSDFNTADNHLVLCNNIFTAPRPPFKYFWALSA